MRMLFGNVQICRLRLAEQCSTSWAQLKSYNVITALHLPHACTRFQHLRCRGLVQVQLWPWKRNNV